MLLWNAKINEISHNATEKTSMPDIVTMQYAGTGIHHSIKLWQY